MSLSRAPRGPLFLRLERVEGPFLDEKRPPKAPRTILEVRVGFLEDGVGMSSPSSDKGMSWRKRLRGLPEGILLGVLCGVPWSMDLGVPLGVVGV